MPCYNEFINKAQTSKQHKLPLITELKSSNKSSSHPKNKGNKKGKVDYYDEKN